MLLSLVGFFLYWDDRIDPASTSKKKYSSPPNLLVEDDSPISCNCNPSLDHIDIGKLIDPVYTGTVYLTVKDTVNIGRLLKP